MLLFISATRNVSEHFAEKSISPKNIYNDPSETFFAASQRRDSLMHHPQELLSGSLLSIFWCVRFNNTENDEISPSSVHSSKQIGTFI